MGFSRTSLLDYAFLSLNFLFFCSFNGIINMLFGVGQVVSPIILAICLFIIFFEGFRLNAFGRTATALLIGTFLLYQLGGASSRLYYAVEIDYELSWKSVVNKGVTSLIIIIAYLQYLYRRLYLDNARKRVLLFLIIPMVCSIAVLILQPLFGVYSFNEVRQNNTRGMGVFANPNTAATLANIALVFIIDLFFRNRRFFLIKLLLVVMAIVGCVLPFSRTGMVVMVAVIILAMAYFLLKPRVYGRLHLLQGILFIGLPLGVATYVYQNHDRLLVEHLDYAQRSRILALEKVVFEGKLDKKTTSERSDLFVYAVDLIGKRPIQGYGLGYFNDIPGWIGVHNTFLLTIGNSGVLPFLLLSGLFVHLFFISLFRRQSGFLILGLTTVAFLTFMTSHNGYDDKILNIMLLLPAAFAAYDRPQIADAPKQTLCVE